MQVDRQAEAVLERGRQGQVGRAAPIDHQGIAHGGGGAVQIEGHLAGGRAPGAEALEQLPGPLRLHPLLAGVRQQLGHKGAVEVPLDVAALGGDGGGIADLQLHLQSMALQQLGPLAPLLN